MTAPRGSSTPLDIYLQPAVVGGGLGDIEEVLAVGRRLERLGWTPFLYRAGGRELPPSADGPWGWPSVRPIDRVRPRSSRALTVTPWWGVSAAPARERPGPVGSWSVETDEIEAAYGREQVVHLSLEEFARTLTSRQQTRERWREGGVPVRTFSRRLARRAARHEIRTFHEEYRKWRAFGRSNVLHFFTGFRASRAFAKEFPEAIQCGPLWPEALPAKGSPTRRRRWVWYASPSTSDRLAAELARSFASPDAGKPTLQIEVRGPRPFDLPSSPQLRWHWVEPGSRESWVQRFARADLRIVTGSRTLLEALMARGPFLYYNGVMNRGSRTRRHRPEKIDSLLAAWRRHGVRSSLRRDLADFSRLRRVRPIVRSAVRAPRWGVGFPARTAAVDYPSAWADAGALIDRWAKEWANTTDSSDRFVTLRRESARFALSRL
jgi:hypothetical protein